MNETNNIPNTYDKVMAAGAVVYLVVMALVIALNIWVGEWGYLDPLFDGFLIGLMVWALYNYRTTGRVIP